MDGLLKNSCSMIPCYILKLKNTKYTKRLVNGGLVRDFEIA